VQALTTLLAVVVTVAIAGPAPAPADNGERSDPGFRVIVHPSNPVTSLDRKFVASAFLKKATRWDDGSVIRPVDQKPRSPTRRRFSGSVLKRSVAAVRNYWRQIVFTGRGVPPTVLDSDKKVIEYVRRHRHAIGYVSAAAELAGVKVARVR
jgi:ABC-type phosphate transport system substrate-binding protein